MIISSQSHLHSGTSANLLERPDFLEDEQFNSHKTEELVLQHSLHHQLVEIEHCCTTERAANLLDVSHETLNRAKREKRDFYERGSWIAYPVVEVERGSRLNVRRRPNFWRVFFRVLPDELVNN
ncbi:MAG: hypothetical protein KME06_02585 [Kastovskya adunca ATA6-11-RM4]|jgi:hypothetical protein|nr:hypothetical protein [Kastovskya adunca ATA6-11-RM4]